MIKNLLYFLTNESNIMSNILNTIVIAPTDNIASKLSSLGPNTLIRFTPGVHEQAPQMNGGKDLIFIDQSNVSVELMAGSILKFPNNSILIDRVGEIAPNQSTPISPFSYSGTYTGSEYVDAAFWIIIDGTGSPNTFKWHKQTGIGAPSSYDNELVPITGSPQLLSDGIYVQMNTTGNGLGFGQIVSFGAKDQMMIRVGSDNGQHATPVENVNIFGAGVLDYNMTNNAKPTPHAIQLPSNILFHGRLNNCGVYGITMKDSHRAITCYGDHSGTYLAGGSTSGGESFDQYNTTIAYTKTYSTLTNYGSGILPGHPEHRGWLRQFKAIGNTIDCDLLPVEPNFKLDQYQISHNMLRTVQKSYGVGLWRKSQNGLINDNVLFNSGTTKECVGSSGAPSGWELPDNIIFQNNYNLLNTANTAAKFELLT